MHIVYNDDNTVQRVDEIGQSFMTLMVHELNKALKDNAVTELERRQEICESFMFNVAYLIDAGWFIRYDVKYFPKICFAERDPAVQSEHLGQIATLHVPTDTTSWHEYAMGVAGQYFDDGEEAPPDLDTGSY